MTECLTDNWEMTQILTDNWESSYPIKSLSVLCLPAWKQCVSYANFRNVTFAWEVLEFTEGFDIILFVKCSKIVLGLFEQFWSFSEIFFPWCLFHVQCALNFSYATKIGLWHKGVRTGLKEPVHGQYKQQAKASRGFLRCTDANVKSPSGHRAPTRPEFSLVSVKQLKVMVLSLSPRRDASSSQRCYRQRFVRFGTHLYNWVEIIMWSNRFDV